MEPSGDSAVPKIYFNLAELTYTIRVILLNLTPFQKS